MEYCSSCARPFRSFLDYPAVHISEVSRFPVAEKFPFFHDLPMDSYVPEDIMNEFSERGEVGNRLRRAFSKRKESIKGVRHLGDFIERDGKVWINSRAWYGCFNFDEKKDIFECLEPYVKSLEDAVEKTVYSNLLMPRMQQVQDDMLFRIPGSGYSMVIGTKALYNLGWGCEALGRDIGFFVSKAIQEKKDIYKVIHDEIDSKIALESKDLPKGFKRVSLYIVGTRPVDVSAVRGWWSSERVTAKFAEFVYRGVTLCDIR